jgi:hypothetical protein
MLSAAASTRWASVISPIRRLLCTSSTTTRLVAPASSCMRLRLCVRSARSSALIGTE